MNIYAAQAQALQSTVESLNRQCDDLRHENENLLAALRAVVRGWQLGLSAGDLHDIAKNALGSYKVA